MKRFLIIVSLTLAPLGCAPMQVVAPTTEQRAGEALGTTATAASTSVTRLTLEQLDALTYGLADNYVTRLSSAADEIKRNNPSADQRRVAHRVKTIGTQSMYDIVTNPDPYTQLLDLVVMITLQSYVWIDQNRAETVFGDRADPLVQALRTARLEVWDIARRALSTEQLELLDYLVVSFARDNPDLEQVEFVKFAQFAGARSQSMLGEFRAGGGFLAPIDTANKELLEYRRLLERAFWYGKRAGMLTGWQVESVLNEVVAVPQIDGILSNVEIATEAVADITPVLAELPDRITAEREAIFAELDRRHNDINTSIAQGERLVVESQELMESVNRLASTLERMNRDVQTTSASFERLINTADTVAHRYYTPPPATVPVLPVPTSPRLAPTTAPFSGPVEHDFDPSRSAEQLREELSEDPMRAESLPTTGLAPFDSALEEVPESDPMRDYIIAIRETGTTIDKVGTLAREMERLVGSEMWDQRISEVTRAADGRVNHTAEEGLKIVNAIFLNVYISLGVLFVLLVAYRVILYFLIRKARQIPHDA